MKKQEIEFLKLKEQVKSVSRVRKEFRGSLEFIKLLSLQSEEIRSRNDFTILILEDMRLNFEIALHKLFEEIQEIKRRDSHESFNSLFLKAGKIIARFIDFMKGRLKGPGIFDKRFKPKRVDSLSHQQESLTTPVDDVKIKSILSRLDEFRKTQAPGVTFRVFQDCFDDAIYLHEAISKSNRKKSRKEFADVCLEKGRKS